MCFSGAPVIQDLKILSNKTSTVVPISWLILSDGGHAPLTFTVYKRTGDGEFHVVSDDIENYVEEGQTINFDVVELLPQTQYDF